MHAGALGGKISGAGGGGFMYFISAHDKKEAITKAIRSFGYDIFDFSFDLRGGQSWEYKYR